MENDNYTKNYIADVRETRANVRDGLTITQLRAFGAKAARNGFIQAGGLEDEEGCPLVEPEMPEADIERLDLLCLNSHEDRATKAELEIALEAYEKEVWRILGSGIMPR